MSLMGAMVQSVTMVACVLWGSMGSHVVPWHPMGPKYQGVPWDSMGSHGVIWRPMGSMEFIGSPGVPWPHGGQYGFPWGPMGSIVSDGAPWSSVKSVELMGKVGCRNKTLR